MVEVKTEEMKTNDDETSQCQDGDDGGTLLSLCNPLFWARLVTIQVCGQTYNDKWFLLCVCWLHQKWWFILGASSNLFNFETRSSFVGRQKSPIACLLLTSRPRTANLIIQKLCNLELFSCSFWFGQNEFEPLSCIISLGADSFIIVTLNKLHLNWRYRRR